MLATGIDEWHGRQFIYRRIFCFQPSTLFSFVSQHGDDSVASFIDERHLLPAIPFDFSFSRMARKN